MGRGGEGEKRGQGDFTQLTPNSLLPTPYSLLALPTPYSLLLK